MAGKQGIGRGICHAGHIRHRPDNIGINVLVNVQAKLIPFRRVETARGLVFTLGSAANMEKSLHDKNSGILRLCWKHKNPAPL